MFAHRNVSFIRFYSKQELPHFANVILAQLFIKYYTNYDSAAISWESLDIIPIVPEKAI